jgi:hypothetical protein
MSMLLLQDWAVHAPIHLFQMLDHGHQFDVSRAEEKKTKAATVFTLTVAACLSGPCDQQGFELDRGPSRSSK